MMKVHFLTASLGEKLILPMFQSRDLKIIAMLRFVVSVIDKCPG